MKSFIPWVGGKTALVKELRACFPESFGRYIEVFGGGGSLLFSCDKHAPIEVYNDANGNLVNLFRCLKHHPDELAKEINYYLTAREIFYDAKAQLDCRGFTDIQRAAMFYVMIKTSFGAKAKEYCCSPKRINTSDFAAVSERLKSVNIEHKDFEALIKQYDRPDALFYCDPPYYKAERQYTEVFSEADHHRLNDILTTLKGRFILSYNDDIFVRELYKDYNIHAVSRQNNLSSGEYKELIITNY